MTKSTCLIAGPTLVLSVIWISSYVIEIISLNHWAFIPSMFTALAAFIFGVGMTIRGLDP